jgi:hypothetical protein
MVASTVAIELQAQLLAWETELESRKGTIAAWEDGLAECDASHAQAKAL